MADRWVNFDPVRVLYDFDGPKIFTVQDVAGAKYLAYQCGEERNLFRFLVVPFSDDSERKLTTGEINLHDALMKPRAWIFDLTYDWLVTSVWSIQVENLPPNCIPKPGVMLWSHLGSNSK